MNRKYLYTAFVWFIIVLVLVCLPGSNLPKPDNWMKILYLDKLIHTFLFGVLAFLFMRPVLFSGITQKKKVEWLLFIMIATSIWGITTEFIQKYLVTGRSFELADWLADTCGAIFAFIFARKTQLKKAH